MPRFHSLRVRDIRQETPECVSVSFEVPDHLSDTFRFTQGQYLTFKALVNGEEVRRNYSICTSPEEEDLRVAVKLVAGGRFSTYANKELKVGDHLEVMPPLGKFFSSLHPEQQKHYVAFAVGSGITPVISIMKTVLAREPGSRVTLFYGNRTIDSIIFREQIEDLKNIYMDRLSVYHILSREHSDSSLFSGRITGEKCQEFCKTLLDVEAVDEFFICGPYAMMEATRQALESKGVDKKKIHIELFAAAEKQGKQVKQAINGKQAIHSLINVTLDGNHFEFPLSSDGETILEAALKGGADLPFACKGGVCSTCKAKLLSGEVTMEVNYALEPEEVEAGYILTCQSHPQTKEVVVDFDC